MDEFSLINAFFTKNALNRDDVVFGIGDDAACLRVPAGMDLLVSTDTLVSGVHFLPTWNACDIAYKAVMVNLSDIAAMAGTPCWLTLALTMPQVDTVWMVDFAKGLHEALLKYKVALIGGDTTRGPLSLTLTIHGLVPKGQAIRRNGAKPLDKIYVSGTLGAPAFAVSYLEQENITEGDKKTLQDLLTHPIPRIDLAPFLLSFATAAIDVSDGLSSDLNHICTQSGVGACLFTEAIAIHPLVKKYAKENALDLALHGGDDYVLCFTVPPQKEEKLLASLRANGLSCYEIGVIENAKGMRLKREDGVVDKLMPKGYSHF
ncbi:MAG: thiamine-phosphate kinase [Tatlockia sp.]|jgi:thiamine-monophosphate kinase